MLWSNISQTDYHFSHRVSHHHIVGNHSWNQISHQQLRSVSTPLTDKWIKKLQRPQEDVTGLAESRLHDALIRETSANVSGLNHKNEGVIGDVGNEY